MGASVQSVKDCRVLFFVDFLSVAHSGLKHWDIHLFPGFRLCSTPGCTLIALSGLRPSKHLAFCYFRKALFNQRGYDVCWASPTGIILMISINPPVVATLQPGAIKREALRASF